MAKAEFRRNRSLAADLLRWEIALTESISGLKKQFNIVKQTINDLTDHNGQGVKTLIDRMGTDSSVLRDIIFALEGTLVEIGSIEEEFVELKNPTNAIIEDLRELKEYSRKIDSSAEKSVKLLGYKLFDKSKISNMNVIQTELEENNKGILNELSIVENKIQQIEGFLAETLTELVNLKQSSKDLLQRKII
ncbi:MAG: hypothetical protein ACXAC7_07680 [Candidatus Hodarchaeales archaeon]